MKKIYYLLALLPLVFTACQKQPNLVPATYTKAMNLTLAQSDFLLLPSSDYPHSTLTFDNVTDANTYIPIILNARDPQLGNGSTASVTYTVSSPYFKLADSVYKDVTYTLTNADYLLLPGNKYTDFTSAQILNWLPYKTFTPAVVNNSLKLITFNYYNAPTTAPATFSFLYVGGAWSQIYTISPAQYASIGHGGYNQFTTADAPTLIAYLNSLLKADPALSATATYGETQYVSFNYYVSGTGGGTYQRVIPLVYNGSNWVNTATITNTLSFVKSNGTWIPDPTVYYTLGKADFALIGASSIGTATGRSNYAQYGDFNTSSSSTYYWLPADIQKAIVLVLTTDFPKPKININYKVTYLLYESGTDVSTTVTYQNNGTAWVQQQ